MVSDLTGCPPPPAVLGYIADLVEFARHMGVGEIEREVEGDERYFAQLAWFEKILARWMGEDGGEAEPDGKGWEAGWSERMRMMWGLI